MATNQSELIDEVRTLTNYTASLISDSEMGNLVDLAKEELKSEVPAASRPVSYFGSDTHEQDRALFWLSCLFAKIRAGEIGAATFTVDELRSNPLDNQSNFWFMMFQSRLGQMEGAPGFGQTSLERADDRSYEFDSP